MLCSTKSNTVGFLAGLGAALIWGAWPVLSRDAVLVGFNAMDIAVLRFGVAGLVLCPVILRNGFGGLGFARSLLLAVGAGTPYLLVTVTGLSLAPAGHGGIIIPSTMLTASTIGAWIILNEKPTRSRLLGLAIVFAGIAATAYSSGAAALPTLATLKGDLLFVAGGILWAAYTVCSRAFRVDPLQATAAVSVLSMIVTVPAWLALGGSAIPEALTRAPADLVLQVGFQGLLAAIAALVLYTKAVKVFGASRGALFAILGPVVTSLLAVPILGEVPTPWAAAGLVLCTLGMSIAFGLFEAVTGALRKYSKPGATTNRLGPPLHQADGNPGG